jgi:hypothetical protein
MAHLLVPVTRPYPVIACGNWDAPSYWAFGEILPSALHYSDTILKGMGASICKEKRG